MLFLSGATILIASRCHPERKAYAAPNLVRRLPETAKVAELRHHPLAHALINIAAIRQWT